MTANGTGDAVRAYRYAAYYAPVADGPWWHAGSSWLGRCAASGRALPQPPVPGVSAAEQSRLTRSPRRYGWHATLKAPFELVPGADLPALRKYLQIICRRQQPFAMPRLKVAVLGDFLALVPEERSPMIDSVAEACVTGLHPLAMPPPIAEVKRRRAGGLTPAEDRLLDRWGYPFVLECFRFHMTLTGALKGVEPDVVQGLQRAAHDWFSRLPPCRFDLVTLFAEPVAGADFEVVEQIRTGLCD